MNFDQIEPFEALKAKMEGMYVEISHLSKKAPDNPINKFKLGFLNEAIREANEICNGKVATMDGFSGFEIDDLPTSSDVVFVLSQYLKAMDIIIDQNSAVVRGNLYWVVDSSKTDLKTAKTILARK